MFKKVFLSLLLLIVISQDRQVLAIMQTKQVTDTLVSTLEPGQFIIDEIMVTAYGPERTRVICRSEVERMSIDGRKRTVEDVVFEELLFQETIRYKIPMDDTVIDKYISSLRQEHNLTLDDIKGIFRSSGYSYEEGREQLKLMHAANSMLEHKVTSRLIVPRDDILKYYNDHPERKDAKYQIEIAHIALNPDEPVEKQAQRVQEKINKGQSAQLDWRACIWLKESDIAPNIAFVKNMKPGDISAPQFVNDGFEVYRLKEFVPERIVSLEKRYKLIEDELRAPRYNQLLAEYKEQIFKDATVIEFVPAVAA
ncbi:MAG: hypothetical protein AB7F19_01800 [Candidatus Babeliales bacterium]